APEVPNAESEIRQASMKKEDESENLMNHDGENNKQETPVAVACPEDVDVEQDDQEQRQKNQEDKTPGANLSTSPALVDDQNVIAPGLVQARIASFNSHAVTKSPPSGHGAKHKSSPSASRGNKDKSGPSIGANKQRPSEVDVEQKRGSDENYHKERRRSAVSLDDATHVETDLNKNEENTSPKVESAEMPVEVLAHQQEPKELPHASKAAVDEALSTSSRIMDAASVSSPAPALLSADVVAAPEDVAPCSEDQDKVQASRKVEDGTAAPLCGDEET
ncbi:unnamed protein product, partial [Amoebophrya sp. A120]